MTHSDLVKKASRWLQTQGCGVVITEMTSGAGQEPDAIGWYPCYSILIECKASRSDFLGDKRKWHQRTGGGMGNQRYYLAPPGTIKAEEVPNGWGLLEPYGNGIRIRVYASKKFKERNCTKELTLLLSAFRRITGIMPDGVSARCYQYETKSRATIGILETKGD